MPLRHLSREHIREILMEQNRWKSYPDEISDKAFPEERPLSRFIALRCSATTAGCIMCC